MSDKAGMKPLDGETRIWAAYAVELRQEKPRVLVTQEMLEAALRAEEECNWHDDWYQAERHAFIFQEMWEAMPKTPLAAVRSEPE